MLELLSQTKDSILIDEVYEILHPESTIENINIAALTSELQQKINSALDDYKSGNYITHEQMKQKVQQWLNVNKHLNSIISSPFSTIALL